MIMLADRPEQLVSQIPAAANNTSRRKASIGTSVGIPPRHINFNFKQIDSKKFFKNNLFGSTLAMALSGVFPEGEAFFMRSVKRYRHRISNPTLLAQISGFIGQEALHSKEHHLLNDFISDHGLDIKFIDRDVKRLLYFIEKVTPAAIPLAITVSLEHFTAIFAERFLRDDEFQHSFAAEIRPLWLWHAVEESEHKTVAWDVYIQTVNSYALRAGVMAATTVFFIMIIGLFQARLLYREKALLDLSEHWGMIKFLFHPKTGKMGSLWPQYLDFYKPSFHPAQHDTVQLLETWREKLFAKTGSMYNMLAS